WDRLSPAERWFLVVALTVMLCFHLTFPPLTILLTGFVLALELRRRVPKRQILRTLAVLLGPVVAGLLAFLAYSEALIHQLTISPDGPSYMLARLVTDGTAAAYLRESCRAGSYYALCPYVDSLPTDFDEFLWSDESPWSKVRQRLSIEGVRNEASDIVIHTIRRYPLRQIKESSLNLIRQLIRFRGIEPLC